jgi:hypothetical protein
VVREHYRGVAGSLILGNASCRRPPRRDDGGAAQGQPEGARVSETPIIPTLAQQGSTEPLTNVCSGFGVEAYQSELERANYEARYRCCSSWLDGRGIALNVGVGISLPGTQY